MFKIIPLYFLLAVLVTFMLLYVFTPKPTILIKYPNIEDVDSPLYIDDNDVCYKYKKQQIDCPNK